MAKAAGLAARRGPPPALASNRSETRLIRGADFFRGDFPFHVQRMVLRRADWQTPFFRRRDFWKLVFVREGEARHLVNRDSLRVCAGDLLAVGPEDETAFVVPSAELHVVNILFRPDLFPGSSYGLATAYPELFAAGAGRAKRFVYARIPRELVRLVDGLEAEALNHAAGFEAVLRLTLAELLLKLARLPERPRAGDRREEILARVDAELLSDFGEPFSLAALARRAGIHPNSLSRLYRKARGSTLSGAWEEHRVEKACEYLASGELSITRIAGEVGFNDLSFFYRTFKRYRGLAPGAWRERRRPA